GREIQVQRASTYVDQLREQHVRVDTAERTERMLSALRAAAKEIGGELIEDKFLVGENLSLVEEPQVVAGGFDEAFLSLPERVVLDVAKDHQLYFGVRGPEGELLPRYLAVVTTAQNADNVRRGNDRVMRARLSDAKFFYDEDLKQPLVSRSKQLDAIVFHKHLCRVGDKVRRMTPIVERLVAEFGFTAAYVAQARHGASQS